MGGYAGPLPSPAFARAMASQGEDALQAVVSGQFSNSNYRYFPIGTPRKDGRVIDAYFSLAASGKDDSNTLQLELDVTINGTSIFTTKPIISHVSGEASTNKTTAVSGDTGVTVGVLNPANVAYSAGDMFMGNLKPTRTASPTTEMANAAISVILSPTK